jgi:hypothetical protein
MTPLRGRMTHRAADCGWEKYSMAGELVSIAKLVLKNSINIVSFL